MFECNEIRMKNVDIQYLMTQFLKFVNVYNSTKDASMYDSFVLYVWSHYG